MVATGKIKGAHQVERVLLGQSDWIGTEKLLLPESFRRERKIKYCIEDKMMVPIWTKRQRTICESLRRQGATLYHSYC